ncbi:hypothetical protein FNV43_RR09035 [Rhamnella rubrinervis]|uniref:F-box protein n=1 Tax=Rhamnella rubrinervis TaxID=2594499 RepID=A0A8K0H9A3_9ROSA|nr:hypothetical protein FNV43_RR09035 [Rhamnella rubrinervis]
MIVTIVVLLMIIVKRLPGTMLHDHDIVDDDDHNEGVDRISELPEHIIHHIMEFLPIHDGLRDGSVLSSRTCLFCQINHNSRLHGFKLALYRSHGQHVTFNFPLIDVFNLAKCCGISSITLCGAKQLKEVDLKFCFELNEVHIDGPTTLEVLRYCGKHYCEIDIASSCKRVKVLQLTHTKINDDRLVTSKFYGIVEELMLRFCSLPVLVNTRCYLENLKVLKLIDSYCEVEFETPNLECFNFRSRSLMRYIPLVISSNKFEARLDCFYHGLSSAYFLMKRFCQSISFFTNCQILTLGCHSTEELIFASDIRAIGLHSPLHGIKLLKIEFSKLHDMVELIDSLLWFAPHPNTISIINVHNPQAVKTIKFNYLEYTCHGECYWQYYLKGVALEKFEDVEEREFAVVFFHHQRD